MTFKTDNEYRNQNDTFQVDDVTPEEIIRELAPNRRELAWLWIKLAGELKEVDRNDFESPYMLAKTGSFLLKNQAIREKLINDKYLELLPDEKLKWITQDKHQLEWIKRAVYPKFSRSHSLPPRLTSRDAIILEIDYYWNNHLDEKEKKIEDLKKKWNTKLQEEKIYDWFKRGNEKEKCSLAWDWIHKNKPRLTDGRAPFTRHTQLVEFFGESRASRDEQTYYIDTIKKRWSQKKYREKLANKKQYNFILTNKTNETLNLLAETSKLSRSQVIEALIESEKEQHSYLQKLKVSPKRTTLE